MRYLSSNGDDVAVVRPMPITYIPGPPRPAPPPAPPVPQTVEYQRAVEAVQRAAQAEEDARQRVLIQQKKTEEIRSNLEAIALARARLLQEQERADMSVQLQTLEETRRALVVRLNQAKADLAFVMAAHKGAAARRAVEVATTGKVIVEDITLPAFTIPGQFKPIRQQRTLELEIETSEKLKRQTEEAITQVKSRREYSLRSVVFDDVLGSIQALSNPLGGKR